MHDITNTKRSERDTKIYMISLWLNNSRILNTSVYLTNNWCSDPNTWICYKSPNVKIHSQICVEKMDLVQFLKIGWYKIDIGKNHILLNDTTTYKKRYCGSKQYINPQSILRNLEMKIWWNGCLTGKVMGE